MRIKILIIGLTVLCGLGFAMWDVVRPPAPSGQVSALPSASAPLEDFTFTDYKGGQHTLYDFKGKHVLINLWATWCAPCVAEFPDLLHIADQRSDDLVLIAISIDNDTDVIERFFKKLPDAAQTQITLDNVYIAHDPLMKITGSVFQATRYPESYLLTPDMAIARKISGALTGDDIQSLLADK
jgi:Thiol-disulfide isomerase and thioredoxins